MMKFVTKAPLYIWPLYLLWGGWKARKTNIVPLKTLFTMPALMFIWSSYSIFLHSDAISTLSWAANITLGIWLGSLTMQKLGLRCDKQKNLIEIGGNLEAIILSMSFFLLRYSLGVIHGLYPELAQNSGVLIIENIATLLSGIFTGRLIGYWRCFKRASHVNLSVAKVQAIGQAT